jgi:hypothetical protein
LTFGQTRKKPDFAAKIAEKSEKADSSGQKAPRLLAFSRVAV